MTRAIRSSSASLTSWNPVPPHPSLPGTGGQGLQAPLTRTVATPCYRAPEVIMSRGNYSSAIDMWSIGCIFGELLQRIVPNGGNITPYLQVMPLFAVTWEIPLTPLPG